MRGARRARRPGPGAGEAAAQAGGERHSRTRAATGSSAAQALVSRNDRQGEPAEGERSEDQAEVA